MRLDDELDRIGANRFHAYALTACALCSSAQSLVMNFLPILQPCAGAAFGVPPQEAAAVSTYTFLMACLRVGPSGDQRALALRGARCRARARRRAEGLRDD